MLARFPRGRLGTATILGNHDYGFRWSEQKSADAVIAALEAVHGRRVRAVGEASNVRQPGVGYVLRVRFNVRPEVTVFRLAPA